MTQQPKDLNDWESCPSGTLSHFSHLQRSRRTMTLVKRSAGVVATGCVLMVAALFLFRDGEAGSTTEREFMGGLACSSVISDMDAFLQGQLDEELNTRITQHLEDCPKCLPKYESRAAQLQIEFSLASGELPPDRWADPSWQVLKVPAVRPAVLTSIVPLLR